ncbi:hypothetical protein COCVIDRAFT_108635, partial [Bipolaris victoriae FI3]
SATYGHRFKKFSHPVRSGLYKLEIGGLVVRWVTTGESPLSYVFALASFFAQFAQVMWVGSWYAGCCCQSRLCNSPVASLSYNQRCHLRVANKGSDEL